VVTKPPQHAKQASARVPWADAARAFCIILVVVGHVIAGFRDGKLIPEQGILIDAFYLIFTFHMPAFFVLSGLFAASSVKHHPRKFLSNLWPKLAYPYFLWATIQILVINLAGNNLNHPTAFDPHEFLSLVWGNISQFWFLKTLFLFHVAYFLFNRYSNDKLLFLLFFIVLRGCDELFLLPETLRTVCGFGIFYALGIALSEKSLDWPSHCRFPLLWAGIFGAIWLVFAVAAMTDNEPVIAAARLRGSLLPASIMGTLFVIALSGSRYIERIKPLLYVGQRTLPIFLLHVMFVAGTRIFFVKILGVSGIAVIMPSAILAGLLGPLAVLESARRFRVQRVLGLG
jgi:fucose 4-O-acetylase-like acetyltransferase